MYASEFDQSQTKQANSTNLNQVHSKNTEWTMQCDGNREETNSKQSQSILLNTFYWWVSAVQILYIDVGLLQRYYKIKLLSCEDVSLWFLGVIFLWIHTWPMTPSESESESFEHFCVTSFSNVLPINSRPHKQTPQSVRKLQYTPNQSHFTELG